MTTKPKRAAPRRASKPTITLTNEQVEQLASEAAEQTLQRFFLSVGIDTSTPEGILLAQRDFQHLRAWRQSVETVKRQGMVTAIGVITVGLLAMLWAKIGNPTSPP